jgi:hypothetical protein
MAGVARTFGVAGFLLSIGLACTQLFGDGRKNTLAPLPAKPPMAAGTLQPMPAPAEATACSAGAYQCSGALLQMCADDLKSWVTFQRCAGSALCQVNPPLCLAATCGADEMTCAGAVLEKCNAERTGWDVFATCLSPAHCNADLRQCLPEPCNPGDRRCDRSEIDQSPVLEACRDDRQDWAPLDACVTRELCDETLNPTLGGGLVLGSDGMVQLEVPTPAAQVVTCQLPACALGEVRCQGTQLQFCSEGRTGFVSAEECATAALCEASLTNFSAAGTPVCLPPLCAAGEHRCTDTGVLQVCNEDRSGFRVIQTCIGVPFCNAALADQGQDGCRSAPCEAGHMQCNGAQIQVCRADQTALDNSGPPCESAALCNAQDPTNAFCEPPTCHRGATSSDEFRCDDRALERCNESLTGYDPIATCVSAALCDASQRFDGCQRPICEPGEHVCREGFLQSCNADQTGFENVENCGSQAACDASAGRCADPCEPGAVRCNTQSGDLEECQDPLTGWQTIADCLSLPLCDAQNRRCNPPVCAAGARRCETRGQNPVITQCAPGREAFNVARTCTPGQICDAQNNECDVCTPNAVRCEGDTLVTCDARGQNEARQACGPGLCSASQRRCLTCGPPGSSRCSDRQLFVCTPSAQGEFEASEFCATDELCNQTLSTCGRGLGGQACRCNDGACRANQVQCNNGQVQRCNDGLTGFDNVGRACNPADLCNPLTGDCNTCRPSEFSCNNGQLRQCAADGRSFARQNIGVECASPTQLRVCNGGTAGVQNCPNGCTNGRGCNQCSGNGVQCVNGNTIQRCVGGFFQDQSCPLGCNTGATSCNACQGNGSSCINNGTTEQRCVGGQFQTRTCPMGCVGGQCASCNAAQCQNGQIRDCTNGQLAAARSCDDRNACNGTESCVNNRCQAVSAPLVCNDGNACTDDSCNPASGCVFRNDNTNNCSDGNICNGEEACRNGRCETAFFASCDDGNECTDDDCDPARGGCVHFNNNESCDDGNVCNGVSSCSNGTCSARTSGPFCDPDPGPCLQSFCDPQRGGCVIDPIPGCCTQGICDGRFFTPCIFEGKDPTGQFGGPIRDCVAEGLPDCDVFGGCFSG